MRNLQRAPALNVMFKSNKPNMDKKERKKLWKERKQEIWDTSSPMILKRDLEKLIWESKRVDVYFGVQIKGIKLELYRHEGAKESFGSRSLLARHFLEKEKWQNTIRESFNEDVFQEIFYFVKLSYEKYKQENT